MEKKTFREIQLEKRKSFQERVNAAFILKTSVTFWTPKIDDFDKHWLMLYYPKSDIDKGNDQGASYYDITPKL